MKLRYILMGFAALALAGCQEQDPASIVGSANDVQISAKGGSDIVELKTTRDWTAEADQDWIHVVTPSGKVTESLNQFFVTIQADQNPTDEWRSGIVTFKAQDMVHTVTVNQDKHIYNFSVPSKVVSATATATEAVLQITADENVNWTIKDIPSTLKFSKTSGTGSADVTITFEPNNTDGAIEHYFSLCTDAYVGEDYGEGLNVIPMTLKQNKGFSVYEWLLMEGVFPHNGDDKVDAGSVTINGKKWDYTRLSYGHFPPNTEQNTTGGIQLLRAADCVEMTFSSDAFPGGVHEVQIEASYAACGDITPTVTVGTLTKPFDHAPVLNSYANGYEIYTCTDIDATGTLKIYFPKPAATICLRRIIVKYFD